MRAGWGRRGLIAVAAFYLLAVLDLAIPTGVSIKRLTSPAWTFTVLMAASLCAVSILVRPSGDFWVQTRVKDAKNVS